MANFRVMTCKEFMTSPLPSLTFKTKRKRKMKIEYCDDIITFDTEFSSIERLDGYSIKRKGQVRQIKAAGLLYLWQACIFGVVVMGRTMSEWRELWNFLAKSYKLGEKRRILCFVHNLECDFMYLQGWAEKWDVFAPNERAVLTAFSDGIEYRCSYKLTNMSLDKFTQSEGVPTRKQDGGRYDYHKLRTPDTPLEGFELYYGYCDVRGLYEAILSLMEKNGDDVTTLPLTSTGYVRRDCREAMKKNPRNWQDFQRFELDAEQYKMLREAFRGGNTHANRFWAGKILNNLMSFDKTSDYPSAMIYEKYPSGPMTEDPAYTMEDLKKIEARGYGYVCKCEFNNLSTADYIPYIASSKCKYQDIGAVLNGKLTIDNGRVLFASGTTTITLTDVDVKIIREHYEFTGFRVLKCYRYQMDYLPDELRGVIIDYYAKKTTLKGVEGSEYFYAKSKNKLNGTYGMTVQASAPFPIIYNKGQWTTDTPSDIDGFYEEVLGKFYRNRNNFLTYQWGVYVAAYARAYLQEAIDICGPYVVYCDTDSVKFLYNEDIANKLLAINDRIRKQAETCGFDAIQIDRKGREQVLGVWDREEDYEKFVTLGAKKYAFNHVYKAGTKKKIKKVLQTVTENNTIEFDGIKYCFTTTTEKTAESEITRTEDEIEFGITVSGLSKKAAKVFGSIEYFEPGTVIEDSGRTVAIYDDNIDPHYLEIEGKTYELRGNVAILETSYTLGITDLYANVINGTDYAETQTINGKKYKVTSSAFYDPQ